MSLSRRELLKLAGTSAAALALGDRSLANTRTSIGIGFDGVGADLPRLPMDVRGVLPPACEGTLYRNGPALYERGDMRYEHWFDPDGMIQAFELRGGGANHRGRFVRTDKYLRESAAGKFLYNGAGTVFPDAAPVRNNDSVNVANINIQPINGELLALWEAGSPYRIDPETLETRERVNWSEDLAGVPFSAHPKFDAEGDMWNIGSVPFAGDPKLVLYHIGRDGRLKNYRVADLDFAGYQHDFVLTPRHLVVLNSSAVFTEGDTFVDSIHWQPNRASQVLVFDRNDFSLVRTFEVPATFVFHFGNGWEARDILSFTACSHANASLMKQGMKRLARREPGPYDSGPDLCRYDLDLATGHVAITPLDTVLEFPSVNPRMPFEPQPVLGVGGQRDTRTGMANQIIRVDPRSGERQGFAYGGAYVVEEPLVIAHAGGNYAIHTYLDSAREKTGLSILSVDHLEDGPVFQAEMDRVLPLGFHGCFMS